MSMGHTVILILLTSTSVPAAQEQFGTESEARPTLEKAVIALKESKEKALKNFNRRKVYLGTAACMCSAPRPRTAFSQRIPI